MKAVKSLLMYYKKMSPAKRASLWFLFISFIQKGSSFLITPFFTKLLSTENYGVINIYQSWESIISPIVTANLACAGYYKSLLDHENDSDSYTSSLLFLDLVIIVAFFILMTLFKDALTAYSGLPYVLWCYMFLFIFLTQATTIWSMQKRFNYQYVAFSIITIITSVLGPIFAVVLLNTKLFENEAFVKIIGTTVFALLIGLFFTIYLLKKGKRLISVSFWREALTLSIPLIPHVLSMNVLNSSDRIMIGNYIGSSATALYSIAYSISAIISVIWSAIDSSLAPWMMRNIKDGKYEKINQKSISLLLIYCIACFIPVCIAPEVLYIMGSNKYGEAIWCLVPSMVGVMYLSIYCLYVNVEYAVGKTTYIMYGSILAAGINVGLNAIFIPRFGYVAAAYTTFVSYVCLALFHFVLVRFALKIKLYNDSLLFGIIGLFSIAMLLFQITYSSFLIRYIVLGIILSVLFALRKKIMLIFNVRGKAL